MLAAAAQSRRHAAVGRRPKQPRHEQRGRTAAAEQPHHIRSPAEQQSAARVDADVAGAATDAARYAAVAAQLGIAELAEQYGAPFAAGSDVRVAPSLGAAEVV